MPATRRRTERWRDSLNQIQQRGGGIEIAVERRADPLSRPDTKGPLREPPPDLLWRVRLHDISADTLVVEHPGTLGRSVEVGAGTMLIGVIAVGQNRWMFHSRVIEQVNASGAIRDRRLRISMPEHVERCTRRTQQRISTASLDLPKVYCWQLRDASSAVPSEVASRDRLQRGEGFTGELDDPGPVRPDLGAGFAATMANIGGGGVGIKVAKDDRVGVETSGLYWMRIDLRPLVPTPLEITARMAHTHIDSEQSLYAGMAFDFGMNPSHKEFIAEQIAKYMTKLQMS